MSEFSINNIKAIIQDILDTEFHSFPKEKRVIHDMSGYLSFACPICGDSERDDRKRGTLYPDTLLFRCWNCDYKTNLLGLVRKKGATIELGEKLKMIDYINTTYSNHYKHDDFISKGMDKLIDISDLIEYTKTNPDSPITDFKPVQKNSHVYNYLNDRKVTDHSDIYEATYWHTNMWDEKVLINMNMRDDKILGMQVRNLKTDKKKRLYRIFKFSEIYHMVYPDRELDEIEEIGYNKLSYLYNIMNIDISRPITVFEGYIDTKFFPNSIGMVGKNTDPNILLSQDVDVRFFFDYDIDGQKKALEYIEGGQSVFLWDKMFRYWSEKLKDQSKAYRKLTAKNIIDLNDVAMKLPDPYSKLNLEKWFSKDTFDKLYITL